MSMTLGDGCCRSNGNTVRSIAAHLADRAGRLPLGCFYCPFGASVCNTNNGNFKRQTIGSPLNVTQDYTYDSLDRLLTAQESGGASEWSQNYGYDAVGNRTVSGYI